MTDPIVDDGFFKLVIAGDRGEVLEFTLDMWRCNNQIHDLQAEFKDKPVSDYMDALAKKIKSWSPGFPDISQKMAAKISAELHERMAEEEKKPAPAQQDSSSVS